MENCRVERENQAFIRETAAFPAQRCYDALPEGSFRGSGWYGGFTKYRAADRMDIVYPDSWEPGLCPWEIPRKMRNSPVWCCACMLGIMPLYGAAGSIRPDGKAGYRARVRRSSGFPGWGCPL